MTEFGSCNPLKRRLKTQNIPTRARWVIQRLDDQACANGIEDDLRGVVEIELLHQVAAVRFDGRQIDLASAFVR